MDQHFIDHTKRTKEVMNTVKKCVQFWAPVMGLDQWSSVNITFSYENHDRGKGILAETNSLWHYLRADIVFYLPSIIASNFTEREIENVVVHELCHCLLDEMGMEDEELRHQQMIHEERVVTSLAMSFLKLASALNEIPKKRKR
jgi:Zn-dependent peptidase ImmA (M78 family)